MASLQHSRSASWARDTGNETFDMGNIQGIDRFIENINKKRKLPYCQKVQKVHQNQGY